MVQPELLSYIKEQLPSYSEVDLRKVLADAGWQQVDVDAAFALLAQSRVSPAPQVAPTPAPRIEIPVVADVARATPISRPVTAQAVNPTPQTTSPVFQRPVMTPVLQTVRMTPPAEPAAPSVSKSTPSMVRPPMMTSMLVKGPVEKLRVDDSKRSPVLQVYHPQAQSAPPKRASGGSHMLSIVIVILFLILVGGSAYAFWAGLVPEPISNLIGQVIPGFSKSSQNELNADQIEALVPVKFDEDKTQTTAQNETTVTEVASTTTATSTAMGTVSATTTATSTASKSTPGTVSASTTTSHSVTATSTGTSTKSK